MVAELSLSRAAWAAHPKFPEQVLLLGSHASFRATSRRLIERARQGASRANLLSTFSLWKSAMAGHERYEEYKLYPYLEHRWGLDTAPLAQGHEALAEADRRVRQSDGPALLQALEHHDRVLLEHLELEESVVIPALLALSSAEFERYCNSPLWVLLDESGL